VNILGSVNVMAPEERKRAKDRCKKKRKYDRLTPDQKDIKLAKWRENYHLRSLRCANDVKHTHGTFLVTSYDHECTW
jgi:hypothetical protein